MNQRWKAILAFLGVFVAGGICGVFLTYALGLRTAEREHHEMRRPKPGQLATVYVERLTKRLQLTPEQVSRIQPIVIETGEELRRQHRQNYEDMMAVSERMNQRIQEVLTPPQRDQLRVMHQRWREARAAEFAAQPDRPNDRSHEHRE